MSNDGYLIAIAIAMNHLANIVRSCVCVQVHMRFNTSRVPCVSTVFQSGFIACEISSVCSLNFDSILWPQTRLLRDPELSRSEAVRSTCAASFV